MTTTDDDREGAVESTPLLRATPRHTVFSQRQKLLIIATATIASVFSPFSANIYYPALNAIGKELHVGESLMNLTITGYMIFQGLSPTVLGSLSDTVGRRPVYIFCFVTYIGANIGLALQHNYVGLLLLRCLQSSGSSSTVSLAYAVTADVVTSAERGKYVGLASIGPILGPSVGPVAGGLISKSLGWRYIFWFLAVTATAFFIPLFFFLPETCRNVVGDGSIVPSSLWNKSLYSSLSERRLKVGEPLESEASQQPVAARDKGKSHSYNPLFTLKFLSSFPIGPVLIYNGILFAGYYTITSSLAPAFLWAYGFNDLQIGLSFVPIGSGTALAAVFNGILVDWNYKRHMTRYRIARKIPSAGDELHETSGFPVELARLEIAMPMVFLGALSMLCYAWSMQLRLHPAVPLASLFAFGFTGVAAYNTMNVLIVDLSPNATATATGANNLVRCVLGAGATAIVMPMIQGMNVGWTFTIFSATWVVFSPLMGLLLWTSRRERQSEDV